MRLWSLHPRYLDTKGLVALWREGLLAKHVLEGKTKGYKHHPQLVRFKNSRHPKQAIHRYLESVLEEAHARGYMFDKKKVTKYPLPAKIRVTSGQVKYEVDHLLGKLRKRDKKRYLKLSRRRNWDPHPLFRIVKGNIENWEVIR